MNCLCNGLRWARAQASWGDWIADVDDGGDAPELSPGKGKRYPEEPGHPARVPHAEHSPRQRADRSGQSYGGPLRWSDRSAPPDRVGGLVLQPGGVIARGVARGAGYDRMTTGDAIVGRRPALGTGPAEVPELSDTGVCRPCRA